MDSHVLNMYHQARYRTIGHNMLRSTSNSVSSESSCNQNSPEYNQNQPEYRGQDWCVNNNANTTQSSQDSSSDEEEENIEVHEVPYNGRPPTSQYSIASSEVDNAEDNSLVEGDDYDVIQVYAVHPDLDLEASSDEEHVYNEIECSEEEYTEDNSNQNYEGDSQDLDVINISLDTPVVSNVDEYFIKDKNILEIKDEPVVNDVDEYFIKSDETTTPNIDDFFVKHKPVESEELFKIEKAVPNIGDFFATEPKPTDQEKSDPEQDTEDVINESDLEVLPNIEEIKKYLLEDTPCSKLKNIQRSCSVPHSPMNICMDIDDAKTCLSFEDLNLDLSDLTFDNEKDKSDGSGNKSDDIPRTLTDEDINSFLITNKTDVVKNYDDLSHQDMEIEHPVESSMNTVQDSPIKNETRKMLRTSTPRKTAVLEFCIEKTPIKKEIDNDVKVEVDDFVDVESCNDTVLPVLEANNLNSLLEQFEATEKLNTKKRTIVKVDEKSVKSSLTNGMRLQDAGVQLNKNKMRHILMPPTINTAAVRRSPSPVHSDHDYCSSKKRHSLPNLKRGQSLLKPEVLSSNNRILNSRHRSCKNKKVVYHLSSDDESEKCDASAKNIKKLMNDRDEIDAKLKKANIKQHVKSVTLPTSRKKTINDSVVQDSGKSNNSVMNKSACKASDTPCSQNSNGSIKLTIKNKSEVILNCDDKDSQKDNKNTVKHKSSSVNDKTLNIDKVKPVKEAKDLDSNKKVVNNNENKYVVNNSENINAVIVKDEPRPKDENFYTALFSNKQDVQIPQAMQIKTEKRPFDEELQRISEESIKKELEQPTKKKKLNFQEYKKRSVNSNTSSATVSPEAIFPDIPIMNFDKVMKPVVQQTPPVVNTIQTPKEVPKEVFDPIREASRKILMNTKKQKAEALRKRDEDIVMSKIPKVENLQLQPLISDAEMLKIVGINAPVELNVPVVPDKPQAPSEYEEIILVSVGTNTDDNVFKQLEKSIEKVKRKAESPPNVAKSLINFKIKKTDHVLQQNVFDTVKRDKKSPVDDKKHSETKIDRERYKGITAALKSVEKQVDTKISSNSLFASIQDVVMKKAPGEKEYKSKLISPVDKKAFEYVKAVIVRDYDAKLDHGEDKIILHLDKGRVKPTAANIDVQTDAIPEFKELSITTKSSKITKDKVADRNRKRNDSDMSLSSSGSPPHKERQKTEAVKPKPQRTERRSLSKEKRSRSKDRYDSKYRRRSRSVSRGRRRRISHSRSRSRSRGRYRRHRRSKTPYKRKRSPSPYRSNRRSPRRESRRSRTPKREKIRSKSKSPVVKKSKPSPQKSIIIEKKSMTPPLRKPTVSESSDSSTSSSSSSSSSSSDDSRVSRGSSCSPYKRDDLHKNLTYRSYSSDDRESNTPVEERRIVFVGKLEKDITKSTLRSQFSKFGPMMEVRLHSKEDGTRYGFLTFKHARDAWSAVEAAATFPQYDVGFGGRRAFCRQSYADLDGLEAKYTEIAFHGQPTAPARRTNDLSFEEMLLEMKKKLNQRKTDNKRHDDKP